MTQQKIVRHPYGDLLAPISLLTFFLNLHTSFYTMVGFQSVGTLALAINLVWITVRTLGNRFRPTPKPKSVVQVSGAVTLPFQGITQQAVV